MISRMIFCSAQSVGDAFDAHPADAGHLAQPFRLTPR